MAKKKKQNRTKWIITITISAFIISFIFSLLSETLIPKVNLFGGIIILILFILLGVIFDMIGVAVTSADDKPFHSMSARKVKGANIAVKFIKNADKVSSFCNDVVGDICGILSGSAGVMIATTLSTTLNINPLLMSLLVTAIVASLTIGGKALGKGIAIKNNTTILYTFSKIVSIFYRGK